MLKKSITALLISLAVALLALGNVLAAPVNAPALIITRTPIAPGLKDAAGAALSNYFKREQNWLKDQSASLQKANQAAATAQQLIDAAKAVGKDVSSLQTALDQYNSDIANAQSQHDQAANIIDAHNGFDGSGTGTDLNAAYHTVVDARTALREAHADIVLAVMTLRQAVEQWRAANPS